MVKWPDDTFVVIPSYKSANLLEAFLPDLKKIVPEDKICIVDDASGDQTDIVSEKHNITCLKHEVNKGKGAALSTGFDYLLTKDARWIVTMDADGQHSPSDLQNFIDGVKKRPDAGICIGHRCMKIGVMPFFRICSNKTTSFILSLFAGIPIADSQCGYRIYSSEFLKRISIQYNRFEMESEVILKAAALGFPVCFTDIQTLYSSNLSHISHLKDTIRWVRAVIAVWATLKKNAPRSISQNNKNEN